MSSKGEDLVLKKLIESNIKTQEAVSAAVSSVKDLITTLREAAEEPDEEFKIPGNDELKAISAKLDKLLQQNEAIIKMLAEGKKPSLQDYRRI
ncbi:MAG: hypothetical protein NTY99_03370 [DPANN group archaeon]|nr:hypothetical protein [DPANN group archaeon]